MLFTDRQNSVGKYFLDGGQRGRTLRPSVQIGLRHRLSIYCIKDARENELCSVKRLQTKKNMSDVAECIYIRCRYIRSGLHGRDRKSAETNKNMSDIAKIVIARVVITGVHCKQCPTLMKGVKSKTVMIVIDSHWCAVKVLAKKKEPQEKVPQKKYVYRKSTSTFLLF